MPTFLLPCACGNQLHVSPTDAGLSIHCSCGATVRVPNTRGIYALPRLADGEPAERAEPRGWGLRNQLLTAGAICMLLGIGAVGYFTWKKPLNPAEGMAHLQVQTMQLDQLRKLWESYQDGFEPLESIPMQQYVEYRAEHRRNLWISGAVAVSGAAVVVAAFLVPKSHS